MLRSLLCAARRPRRLPALLLLCLLFILAAPPGRAQPPAAEILWDTWGVPHLFAEDAEGLAYAFGWAQMQSHGDLILNLYAEARGRAAEYFGAGRLDSDRLVRTVGIPDRAAQWEEAQSPAARRLLEAFVAGLNDYAGAHGDRLDDAAERVLPVRAADVLAHTLRAIHFTFVARSAQPAARRWQEAPGSNAWAVAPARSASGHALLLANPHLPWSDLFLWYEAQLTAPGLDAYGAALVGMPLLAIAFNDHLGWSHTVNTYDGMDLYALTLAEGGYRWEGGVRPFERRTETLRVRQADGTLREERLVVRRSVHGPVLAERDGRALALRVAGLDAPHLIEQYWDMLRATSLEAFEAALRRLQMPMFNVVYADREGHILFVHNGRVPVRAQGDWGYWQRVVPGETAATLWTEALPYERLPRVLDPPNGWVQNANDPPWTATLPPVLSPDAFPAYLAPRGMDFRPQRSARMLVEDARISFEELVQYKHSTRVELADHVLGDLIAAAQAQGGPRARAAAEVLSRWDRETDADSRGAVLFVRWYERVEGGTLFAVPWSPGDPLATPRGLADAAAAVAALDAAAASLEADYGALDVPWGEVYRLRMDGLDLPANGAFDPFGVFRSTWYRPDADGRHRAVGGDSYVALVEFSDPVRAEVLLPYGNASQPDSPHRGDQLTLYARKGLRPVWRTRAEIEAHLEKRETLRRK